MKFQTTLPTYCKPNSLIRLRQQRNDQNRTKLLKLPTFWQSWLILTSARKMKNHGTSVFMSKKLTNEKSVLENASLKKRRELIEILQLPNE